MEQGWIRSLTSSLKVLLHSFATETRTSPVLPSSTWSSMTVPFGVVTEEADLTATVLRAQR